MQCDRKIITKLWSDPKNLMWHSSYLAPERVTGLWNLIREQELKHVRDQIYWVILELGRHESYLNNSSSNLQ